MTKEQERTPPFLRSEPRMECAKHGERPSNQHLVDRTGTTDLYYCLICVSEWLARTFTPMRGVGEKG